MCISQYEDLNKKSLEKNKWIRLQGRKENGISGNT